jgi:predicted amidohydrolase
METFPSDPADLFIYLADQIEPRFDRNETFGWMHDDSVRDIAEILERAALADGAVSPESVAELLEYVEEEERQQRLFAILLGLDRALLHVNPYFGSFDQGALVPIAVRYALTGVLNSDLSIGALLPRCSFPGRRQHTPNTINDAFVSVTCIPCAEWSQTDHCRIPRRNDLSRIERQGEFEIACVPFVDDASDFEWSAIERAGVRFYRISLANPCPVRDRVARVLGELDLSGATIAVLPELALSEELLDQWLEVIANQPRPAGSNLKWLFVGSGDVSVSSENGPVNRCVLLDRVTAEIVLEQDKVHPFTLTADQLEEWRLVDRLGSDDIEEDLDSGRRLLVAESALGRIVVLVCEDLARIVEIGPTLSHQGISHVFAPVFSKETRLHHWEHVKAKEYANQTGALVVVSNSLVIPRLMDADGPWGTSIAHSPVVSRLRTSLTWSDIAIFRIGAGDPMSEVGEPPVERADDD